MKPVRKTPEIQRETIRTLMPNDLKQVPGGLVCMSYQLSCR